MLGAFLAVYGLPGLIVLAFAASYVILQDASADTRRRWMQDAGLGDDRE